MACAKARRFPASTPSINDWVNGDGAGSLSFKIHPTSNGILAKA